MKELILIDLLMQFKMVYFIVVVICIATIIISFFLDTEGFEKYSGLVKRIRIISFLIFCICNFLFKTFVNKYFY